MNNPRLTEQQIEEVQMLEQPYMYRSDGDARNIVRLSQALRQVRADLDAAHILLGEAQTNLGAAIRERDAAREALELAQATLVQYRALAMENKREMLAAREQVRRLREVVKEIDDGITDQRRRNTCQVCWSVGRHTSSCRMVAALAASEQEEAK